MQSTNGAPAISIVARFQPSRAIPFCFRTCNEVAADQQRALIRAELLTPAGEQNDIDGAERSCTRLGLSNP